VDNPSQLSIDFRRYFFVLRRYIWPAALIFLAVLIAGLAYCVFWPSVYKASCLIVVQPQKIPQEYIRTTVTSNVQERLQIINQQVLSRTRLMEVIKRYGLYPKYADKVSQDELANVMRRDINISMTKAAYFTIEFSYSDPKVAANVANTLARMYVAYNMKLRSQDAVGTTVFLNRELKERAEHLQALEAKITNFKKKHLNELPDARDTNLNLLSQLQLRLTSVNDNLQAERDRLAMLETASKRSRSLSLAGDQDLDGVGQSSIANLESDRDPEQVRQQLARMQTIYTDKHPDVQRLKSLLAKMESRQAEAPAEPAKSSTNPKSQRKAIHWDKSKTRLEEAKRRINQLERESARLSSQIEEVQGYIERSPEVTERLLELTRGYDSLKKSFDILQNKAIEAKMASNLERTQRGEQFEVIDPAQPPLSPYKPNITRALPLSIGLAFALALGMAFFLDWTNSSYTHIAQVEGETGLPVLAVVPPLMTRKDQVKRKRRAFLLGTAYGLCLLVTALTMSAVALGKTPALKNLLAQVLGL
jgi:succinoglycan biosynthesis transport protein ExoP